MESEQSGEKVTCRNCERDVLPVPNPKGIGPNKCPKCHSFIQTKKIKGNQAKKGDSGQFNFSLGIGTGLNSQEMQIVENLVNTGVGDTPGDILKKGIYALASGYNIGGVKMTNGKTEQKEDIDPEKVMDKIQARKVTDAYLDELKSKVKKTGSLDSSEILELVKQKQYFKMLDDMGKEEKGEDGFGMKDMMQLQMIQSLSPQNNTGNGNEDLMKELSNLQQQLSDQKQDGKYNEILSKIESKLGQNQGKSGSEDIKTVRDFMLDLEKIRTEGRTDLEKERLSTQTEIEKRKELELNHKLAEIERKSQEIAGRSQEPKGITKSAIEDLKGTMAAAKELAKELGGEGERKGKDAGELVTDVINKTIDNIGPIAKRYFEDKAAQEQSQPQPQPGAFPPVESVSTQPPNPDTETSEPPQPAPISSEEEMANMMHDQQKPPDGKQQ